MNEYTKIRNEHDRAVILAQLVRADAVALAGALAHGNEFQRHAALEGFGESRAELWKLIGPAPEGEATE